MGSMLRAIGAVVAGFVAASVVMMTVEAINGHVLYPDLGNAAAGMKDQAAIAELMANAPLGALLVVLVGWILGGLVGGWVATRVAGRTSARPGLVLGLLLTLAVVANNLMIPPPLWFWVAGLAVMLPSTWLGTKQALVRPQP